MRLISSFEKRNSQRCRRHQILVEKAIGFRFRVPSGTHRG